MGKVKRLQATPKVKPKSQRNGLHIDARLCLLAIAVVTCLLLIWHYQIELGTITRSKERPLVFSVSGDWQRLSKSEVESQLEKLELPSFVGANVQTIRDAVEAIPWVARAQVRKEWPNILRIAVEEREAIGRWNKTWLLSANGEKFFAQAPDLALPTLAGPKGNHTTVLNRYDAVQAMIKPLGLAVQNIVLSERNAWTILLDNGLELNLGREDIEKRVETFIRYYPALKDQHGDSLEYLDFRYETGIAVRATQSVTSLGEGNEDD